MSIPNIDTFEHDISEEIKTREATIGDIAAASGDLSNTPAQTPSISMFMIVLGIMLFITVIAISIIFFIRLSQAQVLPPPLSGNSTQAAGNAVVGDISYSVEQAVGTSIAGVQKSEYGYTLQLLSYSDVFAYMIKNEQTYADELARAVGSPRDASTTTPPFAFTDVTINNQNMRVGTSGSSTIVYAFVNMKTLLISSSTEGILALRGAILR